MISPDGKVDAKQEIKRTGSYILYFFISTLTTWNIM